MTPMKGAPGILARGSLFDRANPPTISQCTTKGLGKKSRKKPKPGMMQVKPRSAVVIASILTAKRSPGSAPST